MNVDQVCEPQISGNKNLSTEDSRNSVKGVPKNTAEPLFCDD